LKICLISNWYAPYAKSGAGIYVNNIAKALYSAGHEVSVITMLPNYLGTSSLMPELKNEDGIKVYRFHPLMESRIKSQMFGKQFSIPLWYSTELYNPQANFIVKKILGKENPDVVHVHCLRGISFSVVDAVKSMGFPIVYTCHDYRLICPFSTLLKRSGDICKKSRFICLAYRELVKKIINGKIDVVLTPSKFLLDLHTKNGFFMSDKTAVLPLGIEMGAREVDIRYTVNNEFIRFLYVGMLVKHKGVHILINAFRKITSENVFLEIVGDGPYEKELKKLAEGDRRILFQGKKPNDELPKFYKNATMSIVPSVWYDNSPLVIYESLREGTPVISSNMGGMPELITEGYNGFLFEAGNVEQLRILLEYAIDNPSDINKLRANAIVSVKKFDMKEHVDNLVQVYRDCVRGC
jgi:glycosyltransferase involved in cell wall biosynthesis